jgi:hypothetical protein
VVQRGEVFEKRRDYTAMLMLMVSERAELGCEERRRWDDRIGSGY